MTTQSDHHHGDRTSGSRAEPVASTFRTAALPPRAPTTFRDAAAARSDPPALRVEALERPLPTVVDPLDIDGRWAAFERASTAPRRGRFRAVFSRTARQR